VKNEIIDIVSVTWHVGLMQYNFGLY